MSTVRITAEDAADTRVTGVSPDNEKRIESLQVMVFDSNGNAEGYARSAGSTLTINMTCGRSKQFRAAVNCTADLSSISTLGQWEATAVRLGDCKSNRLAMTGSTSMDVLADTDVSINVSRLVSKVSINSITRRFESPALASKTFIVEGIYLINAAGDTNFGGGAPTVWFNKSALVGGDADALLCDGSLDAVLADGASYNTPHSFYCCPNPTVSDAQGGGWSARHTRLVVEAQLDGSTMYYPITLPVLKANHTYTVSGLTITGKGCSSPDSIAERSSHSAILTIEDWSSGASYSENL